jgi:hypothetical protein
MYATLFSFKKQMIKKNALKVELEKHRFLLLLSTFNYISTVRNKQLCEHKIALRHKLNNFLFCPQERFL